MSRPLLPPLFLATILILQIFLLAPLTLYTLYHHSILIVEWQLLNINPSLISATFVFDPTALVFSLSVNTISLAVILFSMDYIIHEKHLSRFTTLVALFVLSINLLIFMPNIITLLIGWDGLGLVSFLLVIYYQNPRSIAAGILTALTNRIGDALIIIAIATLLKTGTWTAFQEWHALPLWLPLILIFAAITKSAQIPFSSWLPAAIAAPTPVSALVHSSTLVTAGVYLLLRFFPLLKQNTQRLTLLLILATLTTTIAGLAALVENDIKKIIALSTLRQLGIIIIRLGLIAPLFTFFHLITHAIFKALLFICAGTIIHYHNNNQDLRLFSNLTIKLPLTSITITIANIALIGIPFLAGFYSKDLIIELTSTSTFHLTIFSLIIFSTLLTILYSTRFIYFTFASHQTSAPFLTISDNHSHNSTSAILLLSTGAIIIGTTLNWILVYPTHLTPLPFFVKLIPLSLLPLGIFTILFLLFQPQIYTKYPSANNFLHSIWFLTPTASYYSSYVPATLSTTSTFYLDQGWNEALTAQGAHSLATHAYYLFYRTQSLPLPYTLFLVSSLTALFIYFTL